jgi:hypothetical protein
MTAVGVEPVTSLLELLGRGDFVSMHAPLNGETHHMMSQPQFQAMKRTALFVNNGRGPTVGRGGAGQGLAGRVDRRGRARRLRAGAGGHLQPAPQDGQRDGTSTSRCGGLGFEGWLAQFYRDKIDYISVGAHFNF